MNLIKETFITYFAMLISILHLSSIIHNMLTLPHMDFQKGSNFHNFADFVWLQDLIPTISFISLPDRYDIGLIAHPSFFNLQRSITVD